MVRKKVPTELEKAEIKLRTLMDKRDQLNEEANVLRGERDQLHDKKRALAAEMRTARDERDAIVAEMRKHKSARNAYQSKAKQLIELRRSVRGKVKTSVVGDLSALRREIERIEMDQQTRTMDLEEENELLDDLKAKLRTARELEQMKGEQDAVAKEVHELDGAIDDLFKKADEEHALVVSHAQAADAIHEKVTEIVKNIAVLIAEANKKHEEFLEVRAQADERHQKVVEMRRKVVSTRDAERAEAREARTILRQQRQKVRKELFDEEKLDEYAEKAVEALLKKGKLEIRG